MIDSISASSNRALRFAVDNRGAVLLSLAFFATRWVFGALGLRFNPELDWMFLSDPGDLLQHPFRSVFYFHAFPPGMNLQTGLLLSLFGEHFAAMAHASLMLFGWLHVMCIAYLGRALGLSRWLASVFALAFSVSPPALFFENLWIYTLPSAALLALVAACFHAALGSHSTWRWAGFFGACALLGCYRSTYHLVWFGLMLIVALAIERQSRSQVLLGAVVPSLVLTGLYLKNLLVFGVFGLTSWGGANLVAVTTRQMPPQERADWVQRGDLSPLANISVFAPPRAYRGVVQARRYPWPTTNEFEKPSTRSPNFNHGSYLEINPRRGQDSRAFLSRRPEAYLRTVLGVGLPQFFEPSTRWHPADAKPGSPHWEHRRTLASYESLFVSLLHESIPGARPFGLYAAVPGLIGWALWRAWRHATVGRNRSILLVFLVGQIAFLIAVSCCFALGENARYRFLVEGFIWLLAVAAAVDALHLLGRVISAAISRRTAR